MVRFDNDDGASGHHRGDDGHVASMNGNGHHHDQQQAPWEVVSVYMPG